MTRISAFTLLKLLAISLLLALNPEAAAAQTALTIGRRSEEPHSGLLSTLDFAVSDGSVTQTTQASEKKMGKFYLQKSRDILENLIDRVGFCHQAANHFTKATKENPRSKKLKRWLNQANRECGILFFELSQKTSADLFQSATNLHASVHYLKKPQGKFDIKGIEILKHRAEKFFVIGQEIYNSVFRAGNANDPQMMMQSALRHFNAGIQDRQSLMDVDVSDVSSIIQFAHLNMASVDAHLKWITDELQLPAEKRDLVKIRSELKVATEKLETANKNYHKVLYEPKELGIGIATYKANMCSIRILYSVIEPNKRADHLLKAKPYCEQAIREYETLLALATDQKSRFYLNQQIAVCKKQLQNMPDQQPSRIGFWSTFTVGSAIVTSIIAALKLRFRYHTEVRHKKSKSVLPPVNVNHDAKHSADEKIAHAASPQSLPKKKKKKKKKAKSVTSIATTNPEAPQPTLPSAPPSQTENQPVIALGNDEKEIVKPVAPVRNLSKHELKVFQVFQLDKEEAQQQLKLATLDWSDYSMKLRTILSDREFIYYFNVLIDDKFHSPALHTILFPKLAPLWNNPVVLDWVKKKFHELVAEDTPKKFEKIGRILIAACIQIKSIQDNSLIKDDLPIKEYLQTATIAKAFGVSSLKMNDYDSKNADLYEDFRMVRRHIMELNPSAFQYNPAFYAQTVPQQTQPPSEVTPSAPASHR